MKVLVRVFCYIKIALYVPLEFGPKIKTLKEHYSKGNNVLNCFFKHTHIDVHFSKLKLLILYFINNQTYQMLLFYIEKIYIIFTSFF